MAKKLYVGGLPYSTSEAELKDLFSGAGNVDSAVIIIDKMTGRSKGFGFVEMASEEEAETAINTFNGKDFNGRSIIVSEARPQEDRPRTGGGDHNSNSFGGYRKRSW
jgi:RNA recognition motif-containing protein